VIALAAAACLLGCSLVAVRAQDEPLQRKISKVGKANHEAILSGHVRTDRNCLGIGVPDINMERPPAHGVVCLRAGPVRLQYLIGGAPADCLGQKPAGIRVVYRPHDGYTGKDETRYIVHFRKVQVDVNVDLTILPDDSPTPNGSSAPAGPSVQEPQKPGPIPTCPALVS
jgi:hypothetical protein